jgi:hypothetical protein
MVPILSLEKLKIHHLVGNLLGSPRAETDDLMLSQAFIETEDYRALTSTHDFNFVVGRRGTGKSALFIKVSEYHEKKDNFFLFKRKPEEFETLEFQSVLSNCSSDYRQIRSIARITWKIYLLLSILKDILTHWKVDKFEDLPYLLKYYNKHKDILSPTESGCCPKIVKQYQSKATNVNEIPSLIANDLELNHFQTAIKDALTKIDRSVIFLFDGLDEGWIPNTVATAALGGLALAASDFLENKSQIYVTLFIRDNIFRSLAHFDPDFSRHIEGNTIRLRWDEFSLLHLVSNRIRAALQLDIESDMKVWNRFAQRGLKERDGFRRCLEFTLFRPRDILTLLNQAYITALRSGRDEIIDDDIEATSKQISEDRLEDLLKEYDKVFPGLNLFVEIFRGVNAVNKLGEVVQIIDREMAKVKFDKQEFKDFAVLGSAQQVFYALYSVGFIGLENTSGGGYIFCHDGSKSNLDAITDSQITCIHPCYWKALEVIPNKMSEEVLSDIHDEYQIKFNPDVKDMRMKMIGELISDLPQMPLGDEAATKFEGWVFRAIKILFSGKLVNPELKPNKNAIQRRDVVATNMASSGFWRRVYEDYDCRQVVFEIKNFEALKPDNFRQALSYATKDYGKFIIIVNRSEREGLNDVERGWVKEIWDGHKLLIFILPVLLISRFMTKIRREDRFDYIEMHLNRRLDTFIRSYLALKHEVTVTKRKK